MSKNMKNMDTIEPSWVQNIDFSPMIGLSCVQFRCFLYTALPIGAIHTR